MTGTGKMDLDFLVQAGANAPYLPASSPSWSERSDLSAPPATCRKPYVPISHATGIMELANAAALAEAAPVHVPFSPVSTHSNSSMEEQIEHINIGRRAAAARTVVASPSVPPSAPTPAPTPAAVPARPRSAPPSTSRQHLCANCGESFSQKVRFLHHLLAAHDIRTHETRAILPCSKCNSAFLRNTDRSKHDACVHQRLRPFRCTSGNCSSSFFFQKDLSKHRSTVHLRHKPFSCNICSKAFGKREHMTSHVKRVHQKLRPFRCDVCDIRLASKYNLQGHLKTAAHAAAETLASRDGGRVQGGRVAPAL